MEVIYETEDINMNNFFHLNNKRIKNEVMFFNRINGLYEENHYYYNIKDTHIDKLSVIKQIKINSTNPSQFSIKVYKYILVFKMYIQYNRYSYKKFNIQIELWESYPFSQPILLVNSKNYQDLIIPNLLNGVVNSLHQEYTIDSQKTQSTNLILDKYFLYGFKSCPCCESLFYSGFHSPVTNISKYLNEVKRVLTIKLNLSKLIMTKIIMIKYLNVEFEIIYQYLVGVI